MPPSKSPSKPVTKAAPPVAAPSGTPEASLSRYLTQTKDEHFNYIEDTNYVISTGSLGLDAEIGGFGPGLARLVGPASAGKTSFSLNVARQFVATVPNSRVLYIKCEGRLSSEIQARCGLPFVKDPTLWATGSVFIFECNVYEVVIGLLRELISNNETKTRYLVILDSMDGLNLRGDMEKTVDEANRVAGAPLLTKQFLQKVSVAMAKHGHLCLFLSQVSAEIKLDPYAKGTPRQVGGAGGNAVQHFASHVLAFQEWYESDLILEDPDSKPDRLKNRPLGHYCKVRITKTDKEKRHITVPIPIKHGVTNGSAVWLEREVADQLLAFGLVTKKGGWLTLTDVLLGVLKEQDAAEGLPAQVNGMNQLYDLLEAHPKVTAFLFSHFKALISGSGTPTPALSVSPPSS